MQMKDIRFDKPKAGDGTVLYIDSRGFPRLSSWHSVPYDTGYWIPVSEIPKPKLAGKIPDGWRAVCCTEVRPTGSRMRWDPCSDEWKRCDDQPWAASASYIVPIVEDYASRHMKAGIAIGDIVRITKKTSPIGWELSWIDGMDSWVGEVGRVLKTHPRRGITVQRSTQPETAVFPVTSLDVLDCGEVPPGYRLADTKELAADKSWGFWHTGTGEWVFPMRPDTAVTNTVCVVKATYADQHRMSGIKVGDRVRIISRTEPLGWVPTWNPTMDRYVGRTAVVRQEELRSGYELMLDNRPWWFPSTSLEKLEHTYRAFTNASEFEPYANRRWRYLSDEPTRQRPPADFSDETHRGMSWADSFQKKVFCDGTPFGVVRSSNNNNEEAG